MSEEFSEGDFVRTRIRTCLDADKLGIISSAVSEKGIVLVFWIISKKTNQSLGILDMEEYFAELLEKVERHNLKNVFDDLKPSKQI